MRDQFKDLGLSYSEALHGVQSAIKYKIENNLSESHSPKHMRVGVDMSKADMAGLVMLLMEKGLFTLEEYLEAVRLHANQELHMHEEEVREKGALPPNTSFR